MKTFPRHKLTKRQEEHVENVRKLVHAATSLIQLLPANHAIEECYRARGQFCDLLEVISDWTEDQNVGDGPGGLNNPLGLSGKEHALFVEAHVNGRNTSASPC